MPTICFVCAACCLSAALVLALASNYKKHKRVAILLKIKKGIVGMKKETVLPLLGQEIVVRDLFGNVETGKLESADDNALTLVSDKRKSTVKKIVALEYISTVIEK